MKLAIGSDHRGFVQKDSIKKHFSAYEWVDVGCYSQTRCDYPEFAVKVTSLIAAQKVEKGILLCGTGIGMAIAANRSAGIYAGVAWNTDVARKSKEDDNLNILCLPVDYLTESESIEIITAWLSSVFKEGRYKERLEQIDSPDTEYQMPNLSSE